MALWKDQYGREQNTPEPAAGQACRRHSGEHRVGPPTRREQRAQPRGDAKESLLAAGLTIEGKIEGTGHVRIAGSFKGDVHVQGNLTIESGAKVTGGVRANTVVDRRRAGRQHRCGIARRAAADRRAERRPEGRLADRRGGLAHARPRGVRLGRERRRRQRLKRLRLVNTGRVALTGKTRICPHCKSTILESASVCPACQHHLRFDPKAIVERRLQPTFSALRVEGGFKHPAGGEPWEYSVVISIRNDRGEEVARKVVGVGALGAERGPHGDAVGRRVHRDRAGRRSRAPRRHVACAAEPRKARGEEGVAGAATQPAEHGPADQGPAEAAEVGVRRHAADISGETRQARGSLGRRSGPGPGRARRNASGSSSATARERSTARMPVYTSPLRRCRETAVPLCELWKCEATVLPSVAEIPSPPLDREARREWLTAAMRGTWRELHERAPAGSIDYLDWRRSVVDSLLAVPHDCVVFTHLHRDQRRGRRCATSARKSCASGRTTRRSRCSTPAAQRLAAGRARPRSADRRADALISARATGSSVDASLQS